MVDTPNRDSRGTVIRWAVILLLVSLASGQEVCRHCPVGSDLDAQFPEAPSTVKHHFFTKKWIAAEAIQAGATSFDAYETVSNEGRCGLEGHNGFPEYESGKELAGEGAIEFGFGWFIRALAFRAPKSFGWISYMTPVYGSALHLRGGIEWYNRCH